MNSRQRVLKTMAHQVPDRVPLDIGGINNTTLHVQVQDQLMRYLGISGYRNIIGVASSNVVIPDQQLLRVFQTDTRCIFLKEYPQMQFNIHNRSYTDKWGIEYKLDPNGHYYNIYRSPLENADCIKDIEDYVFPPINKELIEGLSEQIHEIGNEYCLILEGLREPMFGLPSWLRGTQNFYMDLAADQAMAEALLDRILEYMLNLIDYLADHFSGSIDIIKFADDLGTQNTTLISPAMYRKLIKPRQAKLYAHTKSLFDCRLLLHSCGAVRELIGDFIEIGVDALNPVQISANGMEPAELKKDFGDSITFWGGGIDTQTVLPYGTPEEIRKEVHRNIDIFMKGGGYVFAPVHNIQPGVPIRNIMAMLEAYREYSEY